MSNKIKKPTKSENLSVIEEPNEKVGNKKKRKRNDTEESKAKKLKKSDIQIDPVQLQLDSSDDDDSVEILRTEQRTSPEPTESDVDEESEDSDDYDLDEDDNASIEMEYNNDNEGDESEEDESDMDEDDSDDTDDEDSSEDEEDVTETDALMADKKHIEVRKIMMVNLLPTVTKDTLQEIFTNAKAITMEKTSDGKSLGTAVLEFRNAKQALNALSENFNSKIANSAAKVVLQSERIFIGNLPKDFTEEKLKSLFPKSTELFLAKRKSVAFVSFPSIAEAMIAMDRLNHSIVDGSEIHIQFAEPKNTVKTSWKNSSTLFAGNLPFDITENDLSGIFAKGESFRIPTNKRGQAKGIAYISFNSVEDATKALKKHNNHEIKGRKINLSFADPQANRKGSLGKESSHSANPPSTDIFVGNLSFDTSENELFAAFGIAESAKIVTGEKGQSRGFGYVHFKTVRDATKARNLYNGLKLHGRKINLEYAKPKTTTQNNGNIQFGDKDGFNSYREKLKKAAAVEPTNKLRFAQLSYSCTEDTLKMLFPDAKKIHIATDRKTGKSRGFAFLDFQSVEDATSAKKRFDGQDIDGRPVQIYFAVDRREVL